MTSYDDSIIRARKHGYDKTLYVIQHMLHEISASKNNDEIYIIIEKMFKTLNNEPLILMYEPDFRDVVLKKMVDIEDKIMNRLKMFNNAKYGEAISLMRLSISVNIVNYNMREKIYGHLAQISSIMSEYERWAKKDSLMNEFYTLRKILDTIKDDPEYVICYAN
jgi:hypothetical protein